MIEKKLHLPSVPSQSVLWFLRTFTKVFFYLFGMVVKFQFLDYRFSEFRKQLLFRRFYEIL